MTGPLDFAPLADPFNVALRGLQSGFARSKGAITTFEPDVSVFYGHPAQMSDADFADMAALAGPGRTASLRDIDTTLPAAWQSIDTFRLVQYSGENVTPEASDDFLVLGVDDVPEMTALVELTKPGPFLPRTIEMGTYLGYRENGRLLAMAGQRLHLPGWVEISAVCTHPDARGRGLARRLVAAVSQVIVDGGETPFLHTSGDNPARGLYERMGFILRSDVSLEIVRVPKEQ